MTHGSTTTQPPGDRRHHPPDLLLHPLIRVRRPTCSKLTSPPTRDKTLKETSRSGPVASPTCPAGPAPSTPLRGFVVLRSSPDFFHHIRVREFHGPRRPVCLLGLGLGQAAAGSLRDREEEGEDDGRVCVGRVMVTCAASSSASSSSSPASRDRPRTDHSIFPPPSPRVPPLYIAARPQPLPSHAQAFFLLLQLLPRSPVSFYIERSAALLTCSETSKGISNRQMDPWIGSQPSLSLDLHVGLPPLSRHQAPVAMAKPKVLVEENFLQPLKKEPEV